jgi:AAA15 family ATPase/GTPase
MLLRFSVSNFLSLRDRQELSMVASKLKGDTQGLIESPLLRNVRILPAAIIYGPNGSGKSNILNSLAFARRFVINSHRAGEQNEPIHLAPFAFDKEYQDRSSSFHIDFIFGGNIYYYSFELTPSMVVSEALYSSRDGRRSMLYERSRQSFVFGRNLRGPNKTIETITRSNSLFLSAAAQNNHPELGAISNFFKGTIVHFRTDEIFMPELVQNEALLEKITQIFDAIDTGITNIRFEEKSPPDDTALEFRNTLTAAIESAAKKEKWFSVERFRELMSKTDKVLKFGHKSKNNDLVWLNLDDESAGINQLLAILFPILRIIENGGTIAIDEFGSRLHTRASEVIIALFSSKLINPNGAQLIVATHDTNLLNTKGLRRDQIWFTGKDRSGATHLYPLTDFEIRMEDNLEKGYLQGRFGAIPFAGNITDILKVS